MKFRELLNEEQELDEVISKPIVPIKQKFKEDVLGIKENKMPGAVVISDTVKDSDLNPEGTPANTPHLKEDEEELDEAEELDEEEELEEDITDANVKELTDAEIDELLDDLSKTDEEKKELEKKKSSIKKDLKKLGKTKDEIDAELKKIDPSHNLEGAERLSKLIHRSALTKGKKGSKGEEGIAPKAGQKRLTKEQFRDMIVKRPDKLIGQNSKIGISGGKHFEFYDNTLPAYQGLYYNEGSKKFGIVKTCPSAKECTIWCYASKGFYTLYPESSIIASRIVTYLMNDYNGYVSQLKKELKEAKTKAEKEGKKLVLRWHDSGDVISPNYLDMMIDIANSDKGVINYAYTKQQKLVRGGKNIPDNLHFTLSFGGKDDADIDITKDKHARVVPTELFDDLESKKVSKDIKKYKGVEVKEWTPEALAKLKQRVSEHFKLDPKTVISYDELMEKEYKHDDKHDDVKKKWNVLVWKGHGDDAGMRKDVQSVLLLKH